MPRVLFSEAAANEEGFRVLNGERRGLVGLGDMREGPFVVCDMWLSSSGLMAVCKWNVRSYS